MIAIEPKRGCHNPTLSPRSAMTYTPQTKCPTAVASVTCPMFVGADSFHQLLKAKITAERWKDPLGFFEQYLLRGAEGDDVRLSTAAAIRLGSR
jgi:hypothetical protein